MESPRLLEELVDGKEKKAGPAAPVVPCFVRTYVRKEKETGRVCLFVGTKPTSSQEKKARAGSRPCPVSVQLPCTAFYLNCRLVGQLDDDK